MAQQQSAVKNATETLPHTNGHTDTASDSSLSELSYDGERKQDTPIENTHESGYNTECSNQQSVTNELVDTTSCSSESTAQNDRTVVESPSDPSNPDQKETTPVNVGDATENANDPEDRLDHNKSTPVVLENKTNAINNVDNRNPLTISDPLQTDLENAQIKPKYRVDAEEFVPRAYRHSYENQVPVANFIPVPIIGDMYTANFPNPAFLPSINFVPGFIPNQYFINQEQFYVNGHHLEPTEQEKQEIHDLELPNDSNLEPIDKKVLKLEQHPVDIAKIVNKLEETALEQKIEPVQKIIDKTEITSRKLNEKSQNGVDKPAKRLPNKSDFKMNTPKTESTAHHNSDLIQNIPKVEEKLQKEPLFSKMLKSSVSLIENKSENNRTYKKQTSYNGVRISTKEMPTNVKNYSETLRKSFKKPDTLSRYPRTPEKNPKTPEKTNLKEVNAEKQENKPISSDSWISVSSRKKRKNKVGNSTNDSFEIQVESVTKNLENNIDVEPSIEESVAQIEKTYELKEKEQNLIINETVVQNVQQKVEDLERKEREIEISTQVIENVPAVSNKNEKKVKKTEKPKNKTIKVNKRILINDKELQINTQKETEGKKATHSVITKEIITIENKIEPETIPNVIIEKVNSIVEENVVEIVQQPENIPKPVETTNEALTVPEPNITSNITVDEIKDEQKTETTKLKKKKRKPKPKTSPTTPSNDDAFEFLTETTFSNPESKTNVEVSLELDRMIQRGLYANLEEKLKTYNPSDSFIQSVNTDKFSLEIGKPIETTAFKPVDKLKNFDFSGVLFNTTMNKTFEKLMINKNEQKETSQKKNSANSDFLCDRKSEERDKKNEKSQDESLVNGQHFPITKAVKEWMCKTRENTPEIEILKSVNELRSEYLVCHDLNDSDEEIDDDLSKNAVGLPAHAKSANNGSVSARESHENSPDLLDCWEPDIEINNFQNEIIDVQKIQNTDTEPVQTDKCEEAIEVYESVYGKNEDYLRICKEAQDRKPSRSLNFPRDGGLPYRAICCNVM